MGIFQHLIGRRCSVLGDSNFSYSVANNIYEPPISMYSTSDSFFAMCLLLLDIPSVCLAAITIALRVKYSKMR